MRILLIEDNTELAETLIKLLGESYPVDHVLNGEDALLAISAYTYDLVVLDLSLPDIDGLDILREIRGKQLAVPVLILTARGSTDDRVKGLDRGADDYLTKPFEMSELEARVRALLRRVSIEKKSLITIGGITFDLTNRTVTAGEKNLVLSARESEVLRVLFASAGRLVPKARILNAITTFDQEITENAVEQYVSRLRKKVTPYGITIHATRGLGYHITED